MNPKALQSVGIFLRQMSSAKDIKAACERGSFNEWIANAIITLNSLIDVDRITGLLQAVPEESEVQAIKVRYDS